MAEDAAAPAGIDVSMPTIARMYDYYLGGKDNFAADRDAAERVLAVAPQARAVARQNREFLGRAVRFLAGAGIRQFLDIATGLPTQDNVHQVAQRVAPDARVVYVDHDPVACAHGRALLSGPHTTVVEADMRRPEDIIGHPATRALIDFEQPVAVLFIAALHCLTDEDDPVGVVTRFREAMAPGSYLVVSHVSIQDHVEAAQQGAAVYQQSRSTAQMTLRSREQILAFFDGFEVLEPGLVNLPDWRPTLAPAGTDVPAWSSSRQDLPAWILACVGRLE